MRVSFYTTSMNRLRHLSKTLPVNIKHNAGNIAEFVVLNYNSSDRMDSWMRREMATPIKHGWLIYARETTRTRFHMSHAKNMAARLCTGDLICNIDADTFTGNTLALMLSSIFTRNPKQIIRYGPTGKIACLREDFMKLGGYDETFVGWGNEDGDLFDRGRRLGLSARYEMRDELTQRLTHTHALRRENFDLDIWTSSKANGLKRDQHAADNVIHVNPDGFGKGTVYLGLNSTEHVLS